MEPLEHKQQVRFLSTLAEQNYQDPYYLPFFKQLYQHYRQTIVQVGISSTPTISVRNLPIIKLALRFLGLVVLVFPISTSLIVKQIALTTFLATMLCSSIAWSMNEV